MSAHARSFMFCIYLAEWGGGTLFSIVSHIRETGGTDFIQLFVIRVIYHTLFDFGSENYLTSFRKYTDILFFLTFILILVLTLWHYRKSSTVWFIFLFAVIYTAAIFSQVSGGVSWHISSGFGGERYFAILRICSFLLLVSSLNLLFRKCFSRKNYSRTVVYSCFILCILLLKNYPVYFKFEYQYYDDIERFNFAKPGTAVTIHFPPDYYTPGKSIDLIKK